MVAYRPGCACLLEDRCVICRGRKGETHELVRSFFLIGFFVWVAENISTIFGAWEYPNQAVAWNLVSMGKISSWSLMVIIGVIIVFDLKLFKAKLQARK